MKSARTEAACLASAASDLWANHAMIALIEQQQRRHAEYAAAAKAILAKYETEQDS